MLVTIELELAEFKQRELYCINYWRCQFKVKSYKDKTATSAHNSLWVAAKDTKTKSDIYEHSNFRCHVTIDNYPDSTLR